MPKLSKMYSEPSMVPIPCGDETIACFVHKCKVTPAFIKEIDAREAGGDGLGAMIQFLTETMHHWDATDDNDELIPLTVDGLSALGFEALKVIVEAVTEAVSPNGATLPG